MNREQRRKQFKGRPRKAKEFARLVAKQIASWSDGLEPGTKVKLNLGKMICDVNWARKEDKYRLWCMAHANKVMTVVRDKVSVRRPDLIAVSYNGEKSVWLFHISDLIVVEEETN